MKRLLSFIFVFTFLLTSIFSEKEKNETVKERAFERKYNLERSIEEHPLVEKAETYETTYNSIIDKLNDGNYYFDLDLMLTNGHKVTFHRVQRDLTFGEYGKLICINNVDFYSSIYKIKPISKKVVGCNFSGGLYMKAVSLACDLDYSNLFNVLDNYIEFCKFLNSIPLGRNDNPQQLKVFFDKNRYCILERCRLCKSDHLIDIPDEQSK